MGHHDRAVRRATWAVADQLADANEHHRRAEQDRRAMMTAEQRAAVDHAREVEETTAAGRDAAGKSAFTVLAIGIIAAWFVGAALAHLLPALGVAVTVAGTIASVVWCVRVYRRRMAMLALHLDELEGRDR